MKKSLYIVAVVVLLIVFGVSAFQVGSYLLEGKQQEEKFDELSAAVQAAQEAAKETTEVTEATDASQSENETEPTAPTDPVMLPGYAELHAQNPHMVGWIKIEGTKLDYPVMHSPENPNFYLENAEPGDSGEIILYFN